MKKLVLTMLLLAGQIVAAQPSTSTSTELERPESSDNFLLRLEPHWLLIREMTLDLQFLVSDNFSFGPTASYMHEGDGLYYRNKVADRVYYNDKTYRQSFGLRAAYYFSGAQESSFLLSAFGKYRRSYVKIEPDPNEKFPSILVSQPTNGAADFSENIYGITTGYQWVWMNMLNLTVSGGVSYFDTPSSIHMEYEDGTNNDYPMSSAQEFSYAIDVSIGVKF